MWAFIIIIVGIILDQVIKWWTVANIPLGETIMDNNPILSLTYIQNSGAAWSILEGKMWFFYIATAISVIVMFYMLYRNRDESRWLTIGLAFIISGALGNFIDRVRMQYVVDMFQFEFINFPIFNLADVCITVGVICVFIYIFFMEEKQSQDKVKIG